MRRRARLDGNHISIVEDLRRLGATVQSLAAIGNGCPDLLVGFRRKNYVFELKDPAQQPCKRVLTDDEKAWHLAWTGQVKTVETTEEILRVLSE